MERTKTRNKEQEKNNINKILTFTSILAIFLALAPSSYAATVRVQAGNLNISNNLLVNSNTLFVDSTNNRVGIGTTSPNTKLTVIGGINASGGLNVTAGDVLLATTRGNVGIGTTSPSTILGAA